MVPVSHSFDCADFFGLLAVRRIAIPYPLQPATQLLEEDIAARRQDVAAADHAADAWVRRLEPVVAACADHRASLDLRYAEEGRETGAVVLFGDRPTCWLIGCTGPTGRATEVPSDRAVAALLELLPPRRAVEFAPVTLPEQALDAIGSASATDSDRERIARAAGTNLDTVRSALASVGASTGAGQIGALVRSPQGDAVRSTSLVVVVDGATGRLLRLSGTAPGGQRLASLAPGTAAAVHRAAAELLTATSQLAAGQVRSPSLSDQQGRGQQGRADRPPNRTAGAPR